MLHVALILEGDEVRLVVVRSRQADLTGELARYAAEHARFQLAREDETRFRDLLRQGKEREAVDLYFRRGGRWASERLVERRVRLPEDAPRYAREGAQ